MLLVIDTNILISFFNEKSTARELATSSSLELCSPTFALYEINKHRQDVLDAFSLSRAIRISPDMDGIDFFALAMKLNCPVWSDDKILKKQSSVKVFSTSELFELLK